MHTLLLFKTSPRRSQMDQKWGRYGQNSIYTLTLTPTWPRVMGWGWLCKGNDSDEVRVRVGWMCEGGVRVMVWGWGGVKVWGEGVNTILTISPSFLIHFWPSWACFQQQKCVHCMLHNHRLNRSKPVILQLQWIPKVVKLQLIKIWYCCNCNCSSSWLKSWSSPVAVFLQFMRLDF